MSQTYVPAALRRLVVERAGGRCEYCRVPTDVVFLPHEIDHVVAEKHGGPTDSENLALGCAVCNKRKGSDVASLDPETGEIVALFHPRRDDWEEHLKLLGDARIVGRTATGRTTARFLLLNARRRIEERRSLLMTGDLISG